MKSGVAFNPDEDIPSLAGKVILITGANIGIGKQTAVELAKYEPAELWIGARNAKTGDETVAEIKVITPNMAVKFLQMDLTSFESIKTAVHTFRDSTFRLDILMLNPGVFGGPHGQTQEGYELNIGTNNMGHALLFKLLIPQLEMAGSKPIRMPPRIVILSSSGHASAPSGGIIWENLKSEIARHYPQFTTVAIHPGSANTGLFTGVGIKMTIIALIIIPFVGVSVEEAAKTPLWAARSADVKSGEYYEPIGVTGKDSALSKDRELPKKLWDWTEKELEGHVIYALVSWAVSEDPAQYAILIATLGRGSRG